MATNEIKKGCGLSTEAVLASNQKRRHDLGKIQAPLLMQEPDLRVKLVGDHGCGGPPDSNI
jgi:hypothetical protein